MKRKFTEVSCDECSQAEHFRGMSVDAQAAQHGWLVIRSKHFCNDECLKKYKLKKPV